MRPRRGLVGLNLSELWKHRELLYFLAWRDVKVRYRQTILGIAWAIVYPFTAMVVFTLLFGRWAGFSTQGIPYPIFAYCGLLPWNYFASTLDRVGNSLVSNANLITKVYFPRLMVPISATLVGLLDFAIGSVLLVGMMFFYGVTPTAAVIALPLFFLLAISTALGVGLWLSALNVRYRDVNHGLPFIIQFWMIASPVVYPTNLIHEPWRALYGLNPMAGVIEGFRWALIGQPAMGAPMLVVTVVVVIILLVGGLLYFRRTEKTFADVV
jgi:lipopolysaccharide transport system permease protein